MLVCFGAFKLEEERIRICCRVGTHRGKLSKVAALGFTPRLQIGYEEGRVTDSDHAARILQPWTGFGSHTSTGKLSILHRGWFVKRPTSGSIARQIR